MGVAVLAVFVALIGWLLLSLLVRRITVTPDAVLSPKRTLAIICSACGQPEQITEITDETVGVWGERILCSACKRTQAPTPAKKSVC